MPSRADDPVRAGAAASVLSACAVAVALATGAPAAAAATPTPLLDAARVEQAASAVRADPDLGGTKKEQTWRFRDRAKPEPSTPSSRWLFQFARWLAESGRVVVWILAAIAIAVVVVAARRWLAVRGESVAGRGARLPSHVRELDIRPESLPADIGAAVRELWLAGERRSALSLLYRGALSRLVHSYEVAIGDASTEGDCVRLARAALPAPRSAFVTALVDAWQLAVYGGRPLASEHVLRLCADFDRFLPAVAATASGSEGRR